MTIIHSDTGLTLEMSAFTFLYVDQFSLKQIYANDEKKKISCEPTLLEKKYSATAKVRLRILALANKIPAATQLREKIIKQRLITQPPPLGSIMACPVIADSPTPR